jgi:DNA-binding MarR family transcriptional regulator
MTAMASEPDIETLMQLGLTATQARIYLALVQHGKASAKTLCKAAQMDRGDVYRVLRTLQDMGLVEKILETPNNYRAISLRDGISKLVTQKTNELRQLKKSTNELIQRNSILERVSQQLDQDQFVMIPPFEMHRKKFIESLGNAEISFDSVFSWEDLKTAIEGGAVSHKRALKSGAKIRYLVEKTNNSENTSKAIEPLARLGDFKVKLIPKLPQVWFGIVDKKELFVILSPTPKPMSSSCLWSCNAGIIEIFQSYFDSAWAKDTDRLIANKRIS